MKFRVECSYLTDDAGRTLAPGIETTWHVVDGESVDDVLQHFVATQGAELVGSVLRFAGLQAVATLRSQRRVFTVQIDPATSRGAIAGRERRQADGPG